MEQAAKKSRKYYGYQEAVVSIVVNLILSAVKLGIGVYINSIALLTDGIHSLSDIVTSIVVIIGFRSSEKPPDEKHPFGHGRVENIASLVIAILLIVVGIEFLISSATRLYHPEEVRGSFFFFGLVLLTIAVKEGLARYSTRLSRKIESPALLADAWHHRSDALSSIPAALGVLAASYGVYYVDSLSGIAVSLIIMYMGSTIARGAISPLLGEAPSEGFIAKVRELAVIEGITDVYGIQVHDYGTRKVISLNVKVEPMGLEEAHALADLVEKRISDALAASVVVHIEGMEVDESVRKEISNIVKGHQEVISCHAVDIGKKIDFHILVDREMNLEEAHKLAHHLEDDIANKFRREVIIHVEPCLETCEQCRQECENRNSR